jgi:uncharacterized protein (DUF1697 family)
MDKIKYIALLRGINVGGNNIVKMDELKKLFEGMNFTDVITYIQSGNIIFSDFEKDKIELTKRIEQKLFEKVNSKINVVLLSASEMKEIVSNVPNRFGDDKENYHFDVMFIKHPLTSEEAVKQIRAREGVDNIYEGRNVVYFSRLNSQIAKSYISKIIQMPIYQDITIRNWNTTKKLYELTIG